MTVNVVAISSATGGNGIKTILTFRIYISRINMRILTRGMLIVHAQNYR